MYECTKCGETWGNPPRTRCPKCGASEHRAFGAASGGISFGGSATASVVQQKVLDAQRLTVLGLLATLGISVGFGVGGWPGAGAGIGAPLLLALAFRSSRTRHWLATLADIAIGR